MGDMRGAGKSRPLAPISGGRCNMAGGALILVMVAVVAHLVVVVVAAAVAKTVHGTTDNLTLARGAFVHCNGVTQLLPSGQGVWSSAKEQRTYSEATNNSLYCFRSV